VTTAAGEIFPRFSRRWTAVTAAAAAAERVDPLFGRQLAFKLNVLAWLSLPAAAASLEGARRRCRQVIDFTEVGRRLLSRTWSLCNWVIGANGLGPRPVRRVDIIGRSRCS